MDKETLEERIRSLEHELSVLQDVLEDTLIMNSDLLENYLDLEEEKDELARKYKELKEKFDGIMEIIKRYKK